MSEPAVSLAFFDGERGLHGTMRSGTAVLFDGESARTLSEEPAFDRDDERFVATCGDELELSFLPLSPSVDLGGSHARMCRVTGRARGAEIDCLGTASETVTPPAWSELDAVRTVSALFDDEHSVLAAAYRPRGAIGHGQEDVRAHLLAAGELLPVREGRISTVYDGEGRQRTAGLELWVGEEDFPRRASGTVTSGVSLALEGLRVNVAIFDWRMDGRDGLGAYEITVRDEPASAA